MGTYIDNPTATKLLRFFAGSPEITPEAARENQDVSRETLSNYMGPLRKQGLVEPVPSPNDRRYLHSYRLTDQGHTALQKAFEMFPQVASMFGVSDDSAGQPDMDDMTDTELLDRSTEATDAFNQRSKQWKWVMVRKETPMGK